MTLAPGTRLGPYEIVGQIGAGGMGEVYRAKDTRLGRDVAIKVLPQGFGEDRDRLRRFEQEAKALATLSHPNILAVYDVGIHEDSPYLVMELLEGETLRERLATGAIPLKRALELALQMAKGLAAAHAKGLVHRDLKPANLFLTQDGHLKILDFGLAKQSAPQGDDQSQLPTRDARSLTSEGFALGTVGYMSPEQVTGRPADARSDIFAFGVVLYEILSGRRAFHGSSAFETLSATLKEELPELASPAGSITPALQRFVAHCLEKDPSSRFQTAQDLLYDLGSVMAEPFAAASLESGARCFVGNVRTFKRRWPWVAVGAAGLMLAVGLWAWLPRPETAITALAVLPLQNYSGDTQQDFFVDGMTDALIGDLGQIKALKVISRTSVMQYKGGKKSLPQIAKELGVQGILEGSVLRVGNRVRVTARLVDARQDRQLWSSNNERDLTDVISLQREVVREIASSIRVHLTTQEKGRLSTFRQVDPEVYDMTLRAQVMWEHSMSEEDFRNSLAMFKSAADRDPTFAPAWAGLSMALMQLSVPGFEYVSVREVHAEARAAAEKAVSLDPDLPEAHYARAYVAAYSPEWDMPRAQQEYEKALRLRSGYTIAQNDLGQFMVFALHRPDLAQSHFERARELDPFSPWNAINRAILLRAQGKMAEALQEGLQFRRENPAKDNLMQMGWSYLLLEQYPAAIREFESELKRTPIMPTPTLAYLAMAYGKVGKRDRARAILAELEAPARKYHFSPVMKAFVLVGLGEMDKAFLHLERALSERDPGLVVWTCPSFLPPPVREDRRWPGLAARIRRACRLPETGELGGMSIPEPKRTERRLPISTKSLTTG